MERKLSDYEQIANAGSIAELKRLAEGLQGMTLLHVNSTLVGGAAIVLRRV